MKKVQKRESVGKLAIEAQQKTPESTDPREIGNEMTKPYVSELFKALEDGKKKIDGSFFLVVLTKRERLLKNVIRNYFFYRYSCPTPDYDQAVYRYDREGDSLDLIWVLPNREYSFHLKDNMINLDKEYKGLLSYILDFDDKTLFKKARTFNNENNLIGNVTLEEIHE